MKELWKRNAVVATVLVFVCAAVYLNWRYAGNIADQAASTGQPEQGEAAGEDSGGVKVLGDAALVGGEVVSSEGLTAVSAPVATSS